MTALGAQDVEIAPGATGAFEIVDYLGVADCGTVVHPQGLAAQVKGGAVMGFGMAALERHVYDRRYGVAGNIGFHQAKPPSYLDVPSHLDWAATDCSAPSRKRWADTTSTASRWSRT